MQYFQQSRFPLLAAALCCALFSTPQAHAHVAGDVDGNGTAEMADLHALEAALLGGTTSRWTDLNMDLVTDSLDFQLIVLLMLGEEIDRDQDGLPDAAETNLGSDPDDPDSDDDGVEDGEEAVRYGSDPNDTDSDNDGLPDGDEVNTHGSDPTLPDTDGDSLSDRDEVIEYNSDPTDPDSDNDGLDDGIEVEEYRTRPDFEDTDGDGLNDGDEVLIYGSNPHDVDSDDDGLWDGEEVHTYGSNPTRTDSDGDGTSDGDEVALGHDPAVSSYTILINEFLASNETGLRDEDGHYGDWVELYNPGGDYVPLEGWYLTDDADDLARWAFPAVTISPGGYLVVFASGKDRRLTDGSNLHTNFELSDDGEFLALVKQDGAAISHQFSPEYPRQRQDITYGLLSAQERYFSVPTPGAANNQAFLGYAEAPQFSVPHGYYDAPFTLTLSSATPDTEIRYTLDGTEPTATTGTRYTPGSTIAVNETTWIRAAAFREGYGASLSVTQTYLFLDDILAQDAGQPSPLWPEPGTSVNSQRFEYGMDQNVINDARYRDKLTDAFLDVPSLSIVTDLEHLFDESTGIYVHASNDGEGWERPTSVELLDPEGGEGFQINAGIRIRGGYSRSGNNPKHSFRLFFRDEYGEDTLKYPLFEDEGVDEFRRLDLRTAQNNSWSFDNNSRNTMIRDVFSRDLQREAGHTYTRSRYYHLYINGVYWGVYQTEERPEARFAASYLGGEVEDYDVPKAGAGGGMYAVDGNLDAWHRLYDAMQSGWDDETYYGVQGLAPDGSANPNREILLDLDNLVDYMLIIYYTGNYDAPTGWWSNFQGAHNYYAIYDRVNPFGMQFIVHDSEWTLIAGAGYSALDYDCVGPFPQTSRNQFNPRWLHQELVSHPEYRMYFADQAHKYIHNNGLLAEPTLRRLWDARAAELDLAIIGESIRWGSVAHSRDTAWMNELNTVRNTYFPARGARVIQQFRNVGWYPVTDAPEFLVNGTSQYGGHVAPGTEIYISNPADNSGLVYYALDGDDPRETVEAGGGEVVPPEEGGDSHFFSEDAPKQVLVPATDLGTTWQQSDFDDSAWISGTGGVGYDTNPDYRPYINIDLETQMLGGNTGCYIRIPFTASEADLAELVRLVLGIRWEDGFIAYLNGVKIHERNAPATPTWDSTATAQNGDGNAVSLQAIDVSIGLDELVVGENLLAIHGLNISDTSSDFLISADLTGKRSLIPGDGFGGAVSPEAIQGDSITVNERVRIRARIRDGEEWSPVSEVIFSPNAPASYANLAVTEINYNPHPPHITELQADPTLQAGDFEFVEVMNISQETIDLDGVRFTDGIQFDFDNSTIITLTPGQRIVLVDDAEAFALRYGTAIPVAGEFSGNLNDAGEGIELIAADRAIIQDFSYSDDWFEVTDGNGFTLVVRDDQQDPALWDDKDGWRPGSITGGTPGTPDDASVPAPGEVVINEVLAHSHDAASDWIELYNTTAQAIDLGGWFISDNANDLTKFEIPAGVTLPAGGYTVFYEDTHFGASNPRTPFALSENGEAVFISSGMGGTLTGFSDEEAFGPSETGVSLGRYLKESTGTYNFVAMAAPTPGAANAAPKVGPVVISEIMYHPEDVPSPDAEYVELQNLTDSPITLWDAETATGWRISGGIDFDFPAGASVPAQGRVLLVLNAAAFNSTHPGVSATVYQWANGRLGNGGERIEISRPGDIDNNGTRQYIRVDRVTYDDEDGWPVEADGQGDALHRIQPGEYGNDPANWQARSPSPGN